MAYQNVGTPRFYVSDVQWMMNQGFNYQIYYGISLNSSINVIPTNTFTFGEGEQQDTSMYGFPLSGPMNFMFTGGHNFQACHGWTMLKHGSDYIPQTEVVNYRNEYYPMYDGWSLSTFEEISTNEALWRVYHSDYNNIPVSLMSMAIGKYYDMPHSPDLNLTMSREYGGIKTIETKGGASLSNSFYRGSPAWGDAGAWELYDGTPTNKNLARSGRRVWDLSFSYLQDSDVFGSQVLDGGKWGDQRGYGWEAEDLSWEGKFHYNLLTDDSFYTQVIHKTNGGQLPFIFQPDVKDNTNFAICKFDQSSFSFQQTAPNLYSVKMKIREVW